MSHLSAETPTQQWENTILQAMAKHTHLQDDLYFAELKRTIARELFNTGLDLASRRQIAHNIYNKTRGLDVLQPLMDDPSVTEIMVNGPQTIFYEQDGQLLRSKLSFNDDNHLHDFIIGLFSRCNRNLSLSQPIADARLADGTRANAVIPPAAPTGPILTLRKFTGVKHSPEALLASGFITEAMLYYLKKQVLGKKSVFICGGTGTGKTTLLNVLSNYLPKAERIITIEDSAELQLVGQENLVSLEARQAGPDGIGGIDIQQLLRASLRMRPDRIIIGEVRGAEAADLMQAMNTGHPGALCTGHGNSCADMFERLSNLVLEGSRLPFIAIRRILANCIDTLVHISRQPNGSRKVDEIVEVSWGEENRPIFKEIYTLTDHCTNE
ncbi:MAG: CpaF family protein [Fastidiosipilaceae bacterium]|nr:CpaF family protein [Clostridiaceae bacterium]